MILLVPEISEARVTVFLKHVSNWNAQGSAGMPLEKESHFFVLLVSQLPSAVFNFHSLILHSSLGFCLD